MAAPLALNVYARIRPLNETESCQDGSAGAHSWYSAIDIIDKQSLVFNPARLKAIAPQTRFSTARRRLTYDQSFYFDGVFGPGAAQQDVYSDVAQPLLDTAMAGQNASIFAYGATGCGKSYTITGILDRLADDLFDRIDQLREFADVTVTMTYVQLYQERLEDLLPTESRAGRAIKGSGPGLDLRDMNPDRPGESRVPGLSEHHPATAAELAQLCVRGNRNRAIAATKANSVSSRSHAVLTLHIQRQQDGVVSNSCLSVIDLAGSERAQNTQNRGTRLAEGACINRSLLALGNVINACCSQQRHIPFRESKLTRLLRHSLTGNCHTAMIVCLSPSFSHFDETRNSLEYSRRAAAITRRAHHTPTAKPAYSISDIQAEAREQVFSAVVSKISTRLPDLHLDKHMVSTSYLKNRSTEEYADILVDALTKSLKAQCFISQPEPTSSPQNTKSPLKSPPLHTLRVTSPLKRIRSTGTNGLSAKNSPKGSTGILRQNSKRIHV